MKALTSYFGCPLLSHGSFCDSFKILIRTIQDRRIYLADTVACCKDISLVYQGASTQGLYGVDPDSRHPRLHSKSFEDLRAEL